MTSSARHRGVVALVTSRERTRFFIQQKDAAYPGFPLGYSLFGGAIEAGEDAEEALTRELREELGAAAERLLGAERRCVLAAMTLATGVVLSLFEIVIEAAELEAAHASRHFPDAAVALVRLGSPTHTLRRFAAGQEITR